MQNATQEIKLVRDVGVSGVDDISRLVTQNPYDCVVELVANQYDADSTKGEINYYPSEKKLVIKDNGNGMTPKDLVSFFILGDSPKKQNPISPGGRKTIGKFGVATIVIPNMCGKFPLF